MAAKKSTLHSKLAQSLDKANQRTGKKGAPKAKTPALEPDRKCTKLSVSVFDEDLRRVDAILDYMLSHGHRISTSQAIKLALRTAPLSDELLAALEAVKSEDGRKW